MLLVRNESKHILGAKDLEGVGSFTGFREETFFGRKFSNFLKLFKEVLTMHIKHIHFLVIEVGLTFYTTFKGIV